MTLIETIITAPRELWIGLLLTAGGAYWAVNSLRFVKRSTSARGKVVDYVLGMHRGDLVFYPIIEFAAADGQSYRAKSAFHWKRQSLFPWRTYAVRYDPANPREAEFRSLMKEAVYPVMVVGIGIVIAGRTWLLA